MKSRLDLLGFNLLALSCISSANAAGVAQTWQTANAVNTWDLTSTNWDAGVVWTNGNDATFSGSGETVTVGADALSAGTLTFSSSTNWTLAGPLGNLTANTLTVSTTGAGKLGLASATSDLTHVSNINITSGTLFLSGTGAKISGAAISVTGNGNNENRGAIRMDGGATLDGAITLAGNSTFGSSSGVNAINASIGGNFSISIASTSAGQLNFAGPMTFTGGFTQATAAAVNTISGTSNTYAGTTSITGGTLNLTGSIPNSALSIGNGGKLSGEGSAASLTLAAGGMVNFDPTTPGAFTSTGTLTVPGIALFTPTTTLTPGSTVKILNHGGTTATIANFALTGSSSYRNPVVTVGASDISLTIDPAASLTWSGATATWEAGGSEVDWNVGTANFFIGDAVTFDDTGVANPIVTLAAGLLPGSVTVNNSTVDYTFQTGGLAGTTGLTKSGTGTLTVSGTHTYTGTTTINGGTLKMGSATALGAATAATTISGGGTLDINALNLGAEPVTIAGSGVGGNGAIVNSGAQQTQALRFLTLSGDAAIGGTGRWDMRANTTATLDLAGHKLTKVGANYIPIVSTTVTDGDIDVNAGTLGISVNTLLNGTGTVTANNGGALEIAYVVPAANVTRDIVLNGGSLTSVSGTNGADSDITLNADSILGGNGGTLTLNGAITESGGARKLTKTGTSTFILTSASNNWTGGTVVDNGILQLDANNAAGTGNITVGDTTTGASTHSLRLNGVTIGNDIGIKYTYNADYLGSITAIGGITSTITGDVTVSPVITGASSRGGHIAAASTAGTVLRLMGELNVADGATLIFQRNGVVEYGGGSSTSYALNITNTARLVANNGIGSGVVVQLGDSGDATLDLNGFSTVVDGVTRTANTTIVTNNGTADSTLTVSPTVDRTYAGIITDGATNKTSLVKIGPNTYSVNGANTYTGATTISGGTLQIGAGSTNGAIAATSAVTNNGTLAFNRSNALTFANAISGSGNVVKAGAGTTTLTGTLSYTGYTKVSTGTLSISTAVLADTADVQMTTGAFLNLNHGLTDTVRSLYLDGVALAPGTYGSLTSTATNKVAYITGTGILNVTTAVTGFNAWAATNAGGQGADQDFDGDGMPNAVEYLMGQTGSGFTPNPQAVNGVITWPKDPTANAVWEVRISDNLSVWTPAVTGVTDNGTSIQYTLPTGAQKKFARLQVTIP